MMVASSEFHALASRRKRIGLWLIGACGGVGSTTALGLAALRKRLTSASNALVSELPVFSKLGLTAVEDIVLGGHEIRLASLQEAIDESSKRSNLFDSDLVRACKPAIRAMQRNIQPGTLLGAGTIVREMADRNGLDRDRCPADAVRRLSSHIQDFREAHKLACVVVINVASTERPQAKVPSHAEFHKLKKALTKTGDPVLPASAIYALAAIEAGCPFVNFTPSMGVDAPAIRERADQRGVRYMGNDGKTGETLVKSALAPMFAMRHLDVMSWVGQNMLGNRDGAVLSDPQVKRSKLRSKDNVVTRIVGPSTQTTVSIDYVNSLDDWKVAWDFIHFRGFLDTKMSLQFTWQGSDSVLAAPLIIDLARFAAHESRFEGSGPMPHLAFFFKDPIGCDEHSLFVQWQKLIDHVAMRGCPPSGSHARKTSGKSTKTS